jgi:hypothetical protein
MARASYGVAEGAWYWETKILPEPPQREPSVWFFLITKKKKNTRSHT